MLNSLPIKEVKLAATELSGPMYTRHVQAGVKVIYTKYSKHSNETNTLMGLGRAGRFGQS